MQCPNQSCKKFVSPFDDKCPRCGASLKANPVRNYVQKSEHIIADAETKAKEFLHNVYCIDNPRFYDKKDAEPQDSKNSLSDNPVDFEKLKLVEEKTAIFNQLVGLVLFNPHITGNPIYTSKINSTNFAYASDDATVNAFAAFDRENKNFVVVLFDGYMNFMLAVDAAFSAQKLEYLSELSKLLYDAKFKFDTQLLQEFIDNSNLVISEKALLSSFETLAHEVGHVCYDHVFGPSYDQMSLSESQNMEKDADSFAASVINRSIFNQEFFVSHLKMSIAWAIVEKVGGRVEPGTHPLAIERLRNAIANNKDLAGSFGIDESFVEQFKITN